MSRYRLYYAGYNAATGLEQIGLAVSEDLRTWTRALHEPIIPVGSAGECDSAQTSNPCVLKTGSTYKMWYHGKAADGRVSVCYAESTDGVRWDVSPGPVLAASPEEAGSYRAGFQQPHVLFDEKTGKYRMWFARQTPNRTSIGYAESPDGRAWDVQKKDCLVPTEKWENGYLYYPFVRQMGDGTYELWYTTRAIGRRWQIGNAVSKDGLTWGKNPKNPVLPSHLLPYRVRQIIDTALSATKGVFAKALNGTGSPFLFAVAGRPLMIVHDVGIQGRLSISMYEYRNGTWLAQTRDILQRGADSWDNYFQADPFLLIETA